MKKKEGDRKIRISTKQNKKTQKKNSFTDFVFWFYWGGFISMNSTSLLMKVVWKLLC